MAKRSYVAVTLEVKKKIIKAAAKNISRTKLANQFKIPRTTLIAILKGKDAILKAIEDGSSAERTRLQPRMHAEVEEALIWWIKQVRSANVPLGGSDVNEKALEIAALLNIKFEASQGWLDNLNGNLLQDEPRRG